MTYKEKRALRRENALPQFADMVEGFVFGSVFVFMVVSILSWWMTGDDIVKLLNVVTIADIN
ncbi:hypothetical protein [Veillonella nakazawae]|uniref:hypothetical protein n=1 Tax=Veillonella nakazawae TaxID=2682456 RepID=UPI003995A13D